MRLDLTSHSLNLSLPDSKVLDLIYDAFVGLCWEEIGAETPTNPPLKSVTQDHQLRPGKCFDSGWFPLCALGHQISEGQTGLLSFVDYLGKSHDRKRPVL